MDMPLIEFTRCYLALFYTGVAVFYTYRIITKKKRDVVEVVFPGEPYCSTWWNHLAFRFFRALIWLVCVARWFFPTTDNYLGVLPALQQWPVILAGNALLTAGFLLTIAVHFNLEEQWRSGIDPQGPQRLRTDRFYRYSRNPMFLGVAIAQLGFFLALPSWFSALCLLVGLYTLYQQTLAEEQHLSTVFSEDYRQYRQQVRRWL